MKCAHVFLPSPSLTPLTEFRALRSGAGDSDSLDYGVDRTETAAPRHPQACAARPVSGLASSANWRGSIGASLAGCAAFPWGFFPHSGRLMRTPSLTVAGAVQGLRQRLKSRRAPVSRFIHLPEWPADTLQPAPDRSPAPGIIPSRNRFAGHWRKVMKDLHKRLLLLDAAENLPL